MRLPADVYEPAAAESQVAGRSTAAQVAHWARIGRELERSPAVNHRAVAAVLAGDGSYDFLGEREQALVRGTWAERVTVLRAGLDLAAELEADGVPYSEADQHGNVVVHPARPS